jgi:hypothetical protein
MGAYSYELSEGRRIGVGEAYPGGPVVEGVLVSADDSGSVINNEDPEDVEIAAQLAGERAAAQSDVFAVDGTDKMVSYVPGRGFEQFWPGIGKRLRADRIIRWSMHYQSTGKPETDRSELGLWFQKVPAHHEVLTRRVGETHLVEGMEMIATERSEASDEGVEAEIPVIPANDGDWAITGITAFKDDVTLYAMSPHMHLRGKDMTYVVTYPDGREEILLSVPKFDFNWQLHYELQEPKKIPAGSTIKSVGHFDNSVRNR